MPSKNKILVVDDEEKVQELLMDLFKPMGYDLYPATDGITGVAKAREIIPDLILLDIMLPGLDGFGVLGELKKDDKTKNIPVLFITAKKTLEDTMKAMAMGAVGYIEKPFDIKRILKKVESLLEKP